ncbi:hypothetical protein EsH8_VIII_000937 [Colletotrichum jinshuiense]
MSFSEWRKPRDKPATKRRDLVRLLERGDFDALFLADVRIQFLVANLAYKGDDVPRCTPRGMGKAAVLGALGPVPVPVGTPEVADEMESWVKIADTNLFNADLITTPGTCEDVIELLVSELKGGEGKRPSQANFWSCLFVVSGIEKLCAAALETHQTSRVLKKQDIIKQIY